MDNLKYSEILQLNRAMFKDMHGRPYHVKVLSNITVNSIKELLEYTLHVNKINPIVKLGNYDNIVQDSANCNDDDLVIVFYNLQNVIDGISSYFEGVNDELYISIKEKICNEIDIVFENLKSLPAVIFNMFSAVEFVNSYFHQSKIELLVSDLNRYLNLTKPLHVHLMNTEKIISQVGVNHAMDFRLNYSSKAPYTLTFFKKYLGAIEPIILRNTGKLKKAIIFDCDNTLWKGILGEDGVDKIDMSGTSHDGKIYNYIQQIAVFLSKRGVLIGLCSKNNEHDVSDVLMNHPDMVLTNNFIAIKKVNWNDKAANLRLISSELNIGLDSIIFVDDSSFEINLIKEQLPEIITLQVPTAIYEYPNKLLQIVYKYFNLYGNQADENKTEMYKQQFVRESFKDKFLSIEDYLSSLSISLTIHKDKLSFVPRIAQLTQKTNQFNLTTKRYTENQIIQFVQSEDYFVFSISVEDKFGDSGLTGLCIIRKNLQNPKDVTIDTFLMSCRIIGRNIEFAFIDSIFDWLIDQHFETVTAEFLQTKKNDQVKNFYEELGFYVENNNTESKRYTIQLKDYERKKVEYIEVVIKMNEQN